MQEATVVEVTTALDSTVVDVTHLRPLAKERPWLPFLCGGVLALIAAVSFAQAVALASANDASKQEWVDSGRAVGDYRPARLSVGYDALAGLGFFGAVGCFGFGLWQRGRRFRDAVVAGDGREADLPIAIPGAVKLVEATDVGVVLADVQSVSLAVRDERGEHGVEAGLELGILSPHGDGRYRLRHDGRAIYSHGATRIHVATTSAPRTGSVGLLWRLEGRSAQFLAGSAIVHGVLLAILASIPPDASQLAVGADLTGARLVRVETTALEDALKETSTGGGQEGDTAADEALMSPPEGTTGRPDIIASNHRYAITKRSDTPQLSRAEAIERATTGGVLGVLSSGDLIANAAVGTADFSSGFDYADVRGGIDGSVGEVGGGWGSWGIYNGVGTGPGYGTAKVGRLRFGTCSDDCTGYGTTSGSRGGLHGPSFKKPDVTISRATQVGGADPAIIRRHIRSKLAQIRHCYESRLISQPELSGTVVTSFIISPTGVVQGAQASGSGDAPLDSCVRDVVASIQFPRFDHLVNVKYPFTFHRAGS